jgi:formate hydrogenlyase subunit 6/NADH:ubiquinone oxidoreductase subunit I
MISQAIIIEPLYCTDACTHVCLVFFITIELKMSDKQRLLNKSSDLSRDDGNRNNERFSANMWDNNE